MLVRATTPHRFAALPAPRRRRALAAALVVALAGAAGAQPAHEPDATDIALAWARGSFASPVVCRFGESAQRGLRRIVVTAGPKTSEERVDRVQFVDLGAEAAARCSGELGGEEPNVVGTLYVTHVSLRPRSDTPERDFKHDLEHGPIRFQIVHGRLRVGAAGREASELPDVDFAGGTLDLAPIRAGSDDARRIADLPGIRQLRLDLAAKDGTRFGLPLVELEQR